MEEGWEALTQQHVAEVAGIGRATVYRHWPDRTALLTDVLAAEVLTLHTVPTGDLRTDLTAELRSMRHELVDRRFDRVLVALVERGFWQADVLPIRAAMVASGTANLRRFLEAGVADGELVATLDLDEAIAFLVAPVVYRHLIAGEVVTEQALARVVDDLLVLRRADRG